MLLRFRDEACSVFGEKQTNCKKQPVRGFILCVVDFQVSTMLVFSEALLRGGPWAPVSVRLQAGLVTRGQKQKTSHLLNELRKIRSIRQFGAEDDSLEALELHLSQFRDSKLCNELFENSGTGKKPRDIAQAFRESVCMEDTKKSNVCYSALSVINFCFKKFFDLSYMIAETTPNGVARLREMVEQIFPKLVKGVSLDSQEGGGCTKDKKKKADIKVRLDHPSTFMEVKKGVLKILTGSPAFNFWRPFLRTTLDKPKKHSGPITGQSRIETWTFPSGFESFNFVKHEKPTKSAMEEYAKFSAPVTDGKTTVDDFGECSNSVSSHCTFTAEMESEDKEFTEQLIDDLHDQLNQQASPQQNLNSSMMEIQNASSSFSASATTTSSASSASCSSFATQTSTTESAFSFPTAALSLVSEAVMTENVYSPKFSSHTLYYPVGNTVTPQAQHSTVGNTATPQAQHSTIGNTATPQAQHSTIGNTVTLQAQHSTIGNTATPQAQHSTVGNTVTLQAQHSTVGNTVTPQAQHSTVGNTVTPQAQHSTIGNTVTPQAQHSTVGNTVTPQAQYLAVGNTVTPQAQYLAVGNTVTPQAQYLAVGNTVTPQAQYLAVGNTVTPQAQYLAVGNTVTPQAQCLAVGNTVTPQAQYLAVGNTVTPQAQCLAVGNTVTPQAQYLAVGNTVTPQAQYLAVGNTVTLQAQHRTVGNTVTPQAQYLAVGNTVTLQAQHRTVGNTVTPQAQYSTVGNTVTLQAQHRTVGNTVTPQAQYSTVGNTVTPQAQCSTVGNTVTPQAQCNPVATTVIPEASCNTTDNSFIPQQLSWQQRQPTAITMVPATMTTTFTAADVAAQPQQNYFGWGIPNTGTISVPSSDPVFQALNSNTATFSENAVHNLRLLGRELFRTSPTVRLAIEQFLERRAAELLHR
ncbi:uncharacterized protein LOC143274921 isoform X2 [Babylonia areolata]|uniref:uncharacterized protein LOC143274921 isoform X2 n=2 Tax=Babylonia areolata TaxID=304850 RepID=UPI003FD5FE54